MLLSFIVPVYNVEQYLSKCLNSLLHQDIFVSDYEIIIINDGSTDNSLQIAQQFAKNHTNIKIISQVNQGLGGARNTGIKAAAGKYLFFVDSDDYIEQNCLSTLIKYCESKKLDVLRFNYNTVSESGARISKKKSSLYSIVFSEHVVNGDVFLSKQLGWACYVWQFIFRTEFIKNNHLYFKEKIYFEDVEWLVRTLLKADRVCSLDTQVYNYLQRTGSIMRSTDKTKQEKWLRDKLCILDFLQSIKHKNQNKHIVNWCEGLTALTFLSIFFHVTQFLPEKKKEIIHLFYTQHFFPLKSYRFTLKQKRDIYIVNLSPTLYCFLKGASKKEEISI